MIEFNNVSFGYKKKGDTLRNINLKIDKGECILLCGKSGCGKTTMTKLVNGIIPHFTENCFLEGDVTVAQMDIKNTQMYELSKKVGSVFQNPKSQFFNIDSDSELVFGLENRGANPEYIKERYEDTIKYLKIDRLLHRNIFKMSGGEKQSLAFASIFAMNPEIYVLDEPTANLDSTAIQILKQQIERIKELGKTIIIADHRLYYLTSILDRAIYIDNGEICNIFNREEFLNLDKKQRENMGLRTIEEESINIKDANNPSIKKNILNVNKLACNIKSKEIFKDISFTASEGEIVGIVGKNGTGKTTLIRCISGLIKESEGTVSFNGDVMLPKNRNKSCYMIMQDVNHQLFSNSVWNECELSSSANSKNNIDDILKHFKLYDYIDNHPMALSGGQKQRLAVATGVLSDKKIIIFDEPTSGLDYDHMVAVSRTIKELNKQEHIILVISHDIEFLNIICTKIINI